MIIKFVYETRLLITKPSRQADDHPKQLSQGDPLLPVQREKILYSPHVIQSLIIHTYT